MAQCDEGLEAQPVSDNDYLKLRHLLLGDEYARALRRYVSKEEDLERVASVLADAVRAQKGNSLGDALAPVVDRAIEKSIDRNPGRITGVIFPVIGPAIRKAVSAALADMVQSLNTLLEQSLTFRSLHWRFKAWRAGMPYAQYVLLRTIKFRVEQLLLVHRETGLLLQSVTAPEIKSQDPELVSAMLTAITDFMKDSFAETEETLERIRFGSLELLLFVGPQAVLAVAVRGSASDELNNKASETLESIHACFSHALVEFNGDRSEFERSEEMLADCLLSQKLDEDKPKLPWMAWVLLGVALTTLSYYEFKQYQMWQRTQAVELRLRNEPGYVLVDYDSNNSGLTATILRRESARESRLFNEMLKAEGLPPVQLTESVLYDKAILPETKPSTFELVNPQTLVMPYLKHHDRLAMVVMPDRLIMQGSVRNDTLEMIQANAELARYFPVIDWSGVERIKAPEPFVVLEDIAARIQRTRFYFEPGRTDLDINELEKIPVLVSLIRQFDKKHTELGLQEYQILLFGFADNSGSDVTNKRVSEQRARTVQQLLAANDVSDRLMVVWGVGHLDRSKVDETLQRRVSLQVVYPQLDNTHEVRQ